MPLLNYSTETPADKSIAEIQKILASNGVQGIMTQFEDGFIVALSFQIELNGQMISFRLPSDWRPVLKVLEDQKNAARSKGKRFRAQVNQDQALRVAWRILKDWVEAQMALIEINMVKIEQVFLPYAVMKDGQTLFEHVQSVQLALGSGEKKS